MAKVYSSQFYKIGKNILKDAPKAMEVMNDCYNKLEKYIMLRQVRLVMKQIDDSRKDLQFTIDTAKKVVHNKGKIE